MERERERQGGAGAHESNGKQEGVNVKVTNNVESPYMDMLVLSSVAKWAGHPRGRKKTSWRPTPVGSCMRHVTMCLAIYSTPPHTPPSVIGEKSPLHPIQCHVLSF
ncbi:hypothetical protein QYF36_021803 [Acer negundo]|nr:hypothetical protein QYF36_021803 [Acer negundo]